MITIEELKAQIVASGRCPYCHCEITKHCGNGLMVWCESGDCRRASPCLMDLDDEEVSAVFADRVTQ